MHTIFGRSMTVIGIAFTLVVGVAGASMAAAGDCILWEDQCDANGENCISVCAEWDLSLDEPFVVKKSERLFPKQLEIIRRDNVLGSCQTHPA